MWTLLCTNDGRINLADCRYDVIRIAVGELGIQRHTGKAVEDVNGPRTTVRAIADGFPPLAGERRPGRMNGDLLFDVRQNGQNHRAAGRLGGNIFRFHGIDVTVTLLLGFESEKYGCS